LYGLLYKQADKHFLHEVPVKITEGPVVSSVRP
jgi:hypothetical protein